MPTGPDPAAADPWDVVGRSPFVALTTYRRSGEGVTTPVWIAPDGDALVVTTEANTGKVKRLRNDPRVRLQPCSRRGGIEPGAVVVEGRADIAGPDGDLSGPTEALRGKYGVQFGAILGLERTVRRLQRRSGTRLILRITRQPA